jgi:alkylation response protein AidB-like acyl-CoA dehydrogenase
VDFELTSEQAMLAETVARFSAASVAPRAVAWERAAAPEPAVLEAAASLGLLGLLVPAEQDGAGLGPLELAVALRELAKGSASLALVVLAHDLVGHALALSGGSTDLVGALARGERLATTSLPLAELDALHVDEARRVRGTTAPLPVATLARVALVTLPTGGALLPAEALSAAEPTPTLGFVAAGLATLRCDGTALALFDPKVMSATRATGVIGLSAIALGVGEAALDEARRYASERRQFGQAIADFQATQWKLANAATELAAAWALTAAAASTPGAAGILEASLAAVEAAERAADDAVQIHGGYGYTKDFAVERHYRDAKACGVLFSGSEARKKILARTLLAGT